MESFQALVETMGCWKPLVGIYAWESIHSRDWLRPLVVGNHWLAFTLGNQFIPGIDGGAEVRPQYHSGFIPTSVIQGRTLFFLVLGGWGGVVNDSCVRLRPFRNTCVLVLRTEKLQHKHVNSLPAVQKPFLGFASLKITHKH